MKKYFWLMLLVALGIRLVFSVAPPFKTDMDSFIAWGEQMYVSGPGGFYTSGIWTDYAPGYMYFLWLVAIVKHLFFAHALHDREVYEFLHKSVPITFDLLTGGAIFIFLETVFNLYTPHFKVNNRAKNVALVFSALYLFSPFTIITSAVWGQVDSVYTFFLFLSLYYLAKVRINTSIVLLTVAFVIKPQAIAFVPIYMIFLLKQKDYKVLVNAVLSAFISFYTLTIPFFGLNSLARVYGVLQNSVDVYPYNSLNLFNFWGIMGFWQKDTQTFFYNLSQQQVGWLFYGASIVVGSAIAFFCLKKLASMRGIWTVCLCSVYFLFSAVMLLTRMHERYIYPLFVYILVAAGLWFGLRRQDTWKESVSSWVPVGFYVIISFLHFLNLYYVYIYYQYFNSTVPSENTLYFAISSHLVMLSISMFALYILFVVTLPYYLTSTRVSLADNNNKTI